MNWLSILTAVAASLAGVAALMTFFKRSAVQSDPTVSAKLAELDIMLKDVPVTLRDEGKLLREERHPRGADSRARPTKTRQPISPT